MCGQRWGRRVWGIERGMRTRVSGFNLVRKDSQGTNSRAGADVDHREAVDSLRRPAVAALLAALAWAEQLVFQ